MARIPPRQRRSIRTRRLEVWLPGSAVSINHAYYRGGHGQGRAGRVYLTDAAWEWKEYVRDVVGYEALAAGFPTHEALQGATITYRFHKQRGDADNLIKLTADGIADGLGVNDRIFTVGGASRQWSGNSDRPGVWVVIEATAVASSETAETGGA